MIVGSMFGWDVPGADPDVVRARCLRPGPGCAVILAIVHALREPALAASDFTPTRFTPADRLAMDEGWTKPCSTLSVRPVSTPRRRLACAEATAGQMALL